MTSRSRIAAFLFTFLIGTAILWHPFSLTVDRALRDPESIYLVLALPTSVALILSRWHDVFHDNPTRRAGFALLVLALCLALASTLLNLSSDVKASLGMFALVLLWIGDFAFFFGSATARQFLFPLCFLFWMVPLPDALWDRSVQALQCTSASTAAFLFSLTGTPVVRSGIVLNIPNLTIEVAQECSSIRSTLVLLLVTMVLAYLFLGTFWKQALLVLLALPLAVLKNAIRIVVIGWLGTRVDPSYLTGTLHREGGVLFFSLTLFFIFGLLFLMRRNEVPALAPSAALPHL